MNRISISANVYPSEYSTSSDEHYISLKSVRNEQDIDAMLHVLKEKLLLDIKHNLKD